MRRTSVVPAFVLTTGLVVVNCNGTSSGGITNTSAGGDPQTSTEPQGGSKSTLTSAGGSPSNTSSAGGSTNSSDPAGGRAPSSATNCPVPEVSLSGDDAVVGELITFNDNGGWCWYQDERAIVDPKAGKLVIGSVASGGDRDGYIEAVVYNLATKVKQRFTLSTDLATKFDDHNAPAFVIRPDGKYASMWAGHRVDCYSRYSVYDGSTWATESKFDWASLGCPWDPTATPPQMITYSNLWHMAKEDKLYSAVRSVDTSPNLLISSDGGESYSYYGRLSSTPREGYVAGYYKYWGNGADRIDFVATEAHPRDNDNSLWHGYIKGGKAYDSTGGVVDDNLADKDAQEIGKYTQVFKTGTTMNGVQLEHAWNHDLVRYSDGTIAVLWQARVSGTGSDDPDKRMLYARFDGKTWKSTYLVKAGPKLYESEQDYTGLGALHPDDPNTIYISTTIDPRDDSTDLKKHEIFRGTTCDNGASFHWTPVTQNSTKDNIRPIVPQWDKDHTALLWLRGTYYTAQKYELTVVGTISGK